ncbi:MULTISPECIES: hypothetical protein [Chroococcidiopsis]|uniref:hypothetical protein n=1 Tax=Chroococcidiopsis TaxID=54298 RepID=UPI0002F752E2|nr:MULTISPECIES: hypothetical protein [Chroococcidiopsis]URD49999.1 hypothetical protein M5J74_27305 [Chroococcidiopsis sp. CCNUC1]
MLDLDRLDIKITLRSNTLYLLKRSLSSIARLRKVVVALVSVKISNNICIYPSNVYCFKKNERSLADRKLL